MECLNGGLATGRNDGGVEGCGGGSDIGTRARTGDGGSKGLDGVFGANGYDTTKRGGRKLTV